MKRLILALPILFLVACSVVPSPKTPSQSVAEADGVFQSALVIAAKYASLPRCTVPKTDTVCSDAGVVDTMYKVAKSGDAALDGAWATVRTPGVSQSAVTFAVTAAVNAASALDSIVNQYAGSK